jgi:hypothetical protein
MRSILMTGLFTLLSLMSLAAASQPFYINQKETPLSLEEYWNLVSNTRQAILGMEGEPEAAIRARLNDLAAQWGRVSEVEISGQSMVQIDSSYFVTALRRNPPDLERLANLLDALLRAHEEYPQKVFTLQDVEPLKEILARPEFQWQAAQSLRMPGWLDELLQRFYDLMDRIGYSVRNVSYYGRVPLIIAAALLFVFSLFYISRSLSRNLVREAQLAAESGKGDDILTSKGAMQRAQSLSGQGDYRSAIRYLYLSSLLVLDEQGLLRYDRSRTNREYLRSISSKPELAKPLSDVIDVFDRVWYGYEPVDEQTYQSYVKHVDELREKKE